MSWDEVSYVVRSKTRRSVLKLLQSERTPSALASELHTSIPNISRALRELQSVGLVELLTPGTRVGKIYVATPKGKAVIEKVGRINPPR